MIVVVAFVVVVAVFVVVVATLRFQLFFSHHNHSLVSSSGSPVIYLFLRNLIHFNWKQNF